MLTTLFLHLPIFDQHTDLLFVTMEKENTVESFSIITIIF